MALTCSRINKRTAAVLIATVLTLSVAVPSQAAIARARDDIVQQLFQRTENQNRPDSSEKSSVELFKPQIPPFTIRDAPIQEVAVDEVEQQLVPEPLPPVFDEEPGTSSSQRLDLLKEAGAELPWPMGSYRARLHGSGVGVSSFDVPDHSRRVRLPSVETPDKRHRYMHSILHGFGHDENAGGVFWS